METWQIILLVIGGLLVFGIAFHLFATTVASRLIYIRTLKRESKEKWSRTPPPFENPLSAQMDEIGQIWHKENVTYKKDVHIVNEGLNLYGEYYDFGHKRSVMILSGRTESLRYGYYFARPYQEMGFNVLVFDPRAHGLSDGEFNTVGFEESKDTRAWAKYLHEEHGVEEIVFHGICIGAAGGIYVISSDDCPEYIRAIVTEGMFPNFGESMKNNMRERNRLWFPVFEFTDAWMKHYTHHSMTYGPINVIGNMKKPILMLQSKEDKFSRVEFAQKMFDMCPSENKEVVLFEKGAHSFVRITDTEKYDNAIRAFINKNL